MQCVREVFRKEPAFRIGVTACESCTLCFGRGGFSSAEAPIALLTVVSYQQCCTGVWLWLVGAVRSGCCKAWVGCKTHLLLGYIPLMGTLGCRAQVTLLAEAGACCFLQL